MSVCLSTYVCLCVQKLLLSCFGNLDLDKKLQLAKCGSQTDHKRRTCMGCYACCEGSSFMLAVILSLFPVVIVCVSVCLCLCVYSCMSVCLIVCLCVQKLLLSCFVIWILTVTNVHVYVCYKCARVSSR